MVCVSSLLVSAGAGAATVTVGSPLTTEFNFATCGGQCTFANTSLADSDAVALAPIDGVVVRWRLLDGKQAYKYELRILRPHGAGEYEGVGTSEPELPTGPSIQTFPTDLPIQTGDLIGLDVEPGATVGFSKELGFGAFNVWLPPLADGATAKASSTGESEIAINADVQPPPGIGAVAPARGSIKGGTAVVISGHDLSGASAISFGAVPATSFSVDSDSQITAVSPAVAKPGAVGISATTPAGTTASSAAAQFTYTACVVPKLTGKKLKAARKKLKHANCRLGKVRGHRSKRAKVRKQSPKPGRALPPGSKVNVKVGLGRPKRR
jgi:IPT/TIG domain/PASTA domain